MVHGTAQVSWSHISGEALPVRLQQGKQVPAGTLNHDGLLVVEASKGFQDSTPARIARLTAQAQVRSMSEHAAFPTVQRRVHVVYSPQCSAAYRALKTKYAGVHSK